MSGSLIGTRKESGLHNALKFRYAGIDGETEKSMGDYVCDGLTPEGEIIEVQTGSFGPLRDKARSLAAFGPVRIIHPIIINKYIETLDEAGQVLRKRKSPRKGSEWDLFKSLLYAPELAAVPGLCIELALIDVLEQRKEDGKGSWRRKGASISGRELAGWHSSMSLSGPKDYYRFLPFGSGEEFTTRELAKKAGISINLAGKTLYVLTKIGIVKRIGKKGNSFVYKILKLSKNPAKKNG
ncbi:hypothetical protein AGMMS49587_06150 [Spirochaetia bacterium]|nr:hypothetical protein AGMMS49587_06150 [Spirochaetia bacterium]